MDWLLWVTVVIAVLGLGCCAAPLWIWSSTVGGVLLLVTLFHAVPWPLLVLFWGMWATCVALLHVSSLRTRFISIPLARFVKAQMPPISETEQAAIDAGDVWWEGALMQGAQHWEDIRSFDFTKLTEEESSFLNTKVNSLCDLIDPWEQEQTRVLSDVVWAYLKKERFFSMLIPKADGGLGFSAYAQSCVVSKIATKDISVAVTVMVPNSLGPAELILHYGTPEQKSHYLPRLASCEDIPCFALTAPEAGSDAGGMLDYGVITEDMFEGKKTLGIKLTFEKRYITLAPVATVVGLAFKCVDPDCLLSKTVDRGITLCLLPASHPGLHIGDKHYPIGGAFSNGTVYGKDVFIPLSWVIGGNAMIGHGWRMLMECLAAGRGISLPALATASAKLAYLSTASYARVRKQFKVSIGEFEGIQGPMAEIGAFTYLLEAMRIATASAISSGIKPAVVSAISKYHMTELARKGMIHAMDIHGGKGIILGPMNYLANTYITMPVAITVEGANILTRNLIIFGQGAIRCHPYLLQEMTLALAPELDVPAFDNVLFKHIRFSIEHFFRTLVGGLTAGRLAKTSSALGHVKAQQAVSRMSHALALVSDMSFLMLGGKLKRKEFLSARLGDVLSYLYMTTCMIKYASVTPSMPKATAEFAIAYCLHQIQLAFDAFFDNFPHRWLGVVLRLVVFPLGKSYRYPTDKISQAVAKEAMSFNLNDPIWKTCYLGDEQDRLGVVIAAAQEEIKLQEALRAVRHFKPKTPPAIPATFRDKLASAHEAGAINDVQYQQLSAYSELYEKAINVDSFSK
ncbi:MAG: acyl-CoA dehydrogenase [Gammaproteobacteria bacterium]